MRLPVIIKTADVEDRIGYYDPRLVAMRDAASGENFLSGKPNPRYSPLNMGEYRKIMLSNIDSYLAKDNEEIVSSYNDQLGRYNRGEKESRREILGTAVAAGSILGLTGGAYGGVAGGVVGTLLKVIPKLKDKHTGSAGAMIGAGAGAVGLGSLGFWGMKPFRKREFIANPGDMKAYLDRYRDTEAEYVRKAFANPYTGKGPYADTVRAYTFDDGIDDNNIVLEKSATSPKAIHDAAWGRLVEIGNNVDNLVGPKWLNRFAHGTNYDKRVASTKAMIDETGKQLRKMRDLSLNKVTQDKQYSAGSNTSVIDSLMNQLSKYKEQLNGVALLKKNAMPTIIKIAVSPSKIYAAGLKRLNNLNREAMLLRMPRPSQTIGSGVHSVATDGKKELLSRVNKSIRQVGNIGEASFKRDRRYGGREFGKASDAIMTRLTDLKDRIK